MDRDRIAGASISGKRLSPRCRLTPRNSPALASALGTPALPLRFRLAVRSLRSETAWFTRYRPSLAIRRPSATVRQDRSPSQAPVATRAALPRYHLRRLLPPLTAVACTPLPRLRAERSRSFEKVKSAGLRPPHSGKRSNAAWLRMLALVEPLAQRTERSPN